MIHLTDVELRSLNPIERFNAKIIPEPNTGCWLWLGKGTQYGQFKVNGKLVSAHRFSYSSAIGPIPPELTLDHKCKNTFCVNPSHLEPVPIKINVLRGNGQPAQNARKTHCKNGHLLPASVNKQRVCKICRADYHRLRPKPEHKIRVWNTKPALQRVLKKCRQDGKCWTWLGGKRRNVGKGRAGDATLKAHRVLFEHYQAMIPADRKIRRTCVNQSCVNPFHYEMLP